MQLKRASSRRHPGPQRSTHWGSCGRAIETRARANQPSAMLEHKERIMSGALNSVLGGANPLGAILNIASVVFPPLGIATSVANMITQGVGQAVNQAAQQLCQSAGMPKFLTEIIVCIVKEAVGKLNLHSQSRLDH